MQFFTGWQYLLIDVANHWGLDKLIFNERIQWAEDNLENLEQLAHDRGDWKEKPLYLKACMAIRDAQVAKVSGHMVSMDAVCSGMQIMSVLSGCKTGALVTGLIDPDVRADAYTELTAVMSKLLNKDYSSERKRIKNACMTSLYGSRAEPIKAFGEDTPELNAFYQAMVMIAPGACELLTALLDSWQGNALAHLWTLPDGFEVRIKTMVEKKARLEVNEIGSSFTYIWYENEPVEHDVKNAANIIHSVDGYILRSLVRRCNYDVKSVSMACRLLEAELIERVFADEEMGLPCEPTTNEMGHPGIRNYANLYADTKVSDIGVLRYLDADQVQHLKTEHIQKLLRTCRQMLKHSPFEIITIHDDFKCHPNNMNHLRNHYRNILADLADGDYLSHVFSEIHGREGQYLKRSDDLGDLIRKSNYALS